MMHLLLLDIGIALALAYAAVVLLIAAFQSHLVYFPEIGRADVGTPRTRGLEFEEVRIETADGERLRAWWIPRPGARGVAIVFNGNAGNLSQRVDYAVMFSRLGYSTLLFDYRGYGTSTGTPSETGTYRDAEAVWSHVTRSRGAAPRDVVLLGESLGAGVASWLATRITPRALVLASAFTSVPDLGAQVYWFLPVRLMARIRYPVLDNLARVNTPVMIAHSREDDIVPFPHGERLFAAAREPKQFLEMHGGHNDGFIFMREAWAEALGQFLHAAEARTGKP
jgi:fermentation-respiration switch protein FrsA (DUF1100 family)